MCQLRRRRVDRLGSAAGRRCLITKTIQIWNNRRTYERASWSPNGVVAGFGNIQEA